MVTRENADRKPPAELGKRGSKLWEDVIGTLELDAARIGMLEEACRMADRLDALDAALRSQDAIYSVERDEKDVSGRRFLLVVDEALKEARQQQNVFKQLLAALRLPDPVSQKQPQRRSGARGVHSPKGSNVTAIDRARKAR